MIRSAIYVQCVVMLFLICGCSNQTRAERDIAHVLDEYREPQGLSGNQAFDHKVEKVQPYQDIISTSPLAWPDFEANHRVSELVDRHGLDTVYNALADEIRGKRFPRANHALTLLSHIDPSDRWIDIWVGRTTTTD